MYSLERLGCLHGPLYATRRQVHQNAFSRKRAHVLGWVVFPRNRLPVRLFPVKVLLISCTRGCGTLLLLSCVHLILTLRLHDTYFFLSLAEASLEFTAEQIAEWVSFGPGKPPGKPPFAPEAVAASSAAKPLRKAFAEKIAKEIGGKFKKVEKALDIAAGAAEEKTALNALRPAYLDPPSGTRDFYPEDLRLQKWLFGCVLCVEGAEGVGVACVQRARGVQRCARACVRVHVCARFRGPRFFMYVP